MSELTAGGWGLVAGAALLLGAAAGYFAPFPKRLIAAFMAFGSGALISAVSFELMAEAYRRGSFVAVSTGFLLGAGAFTLANLAINARGGLHRKRSQGQQAEGNAKAIFVGALLDGVPESAAIGISLFEGGAVSLVTVAAVFLSNLPEGLSAAAGMKKAGHGPGYVFGLWGSAALVMGIAAALGFALLGGGSPELIAAALAVAAGAILAMLADTMMPEAFEEAGNFVGIVTVLGFLAAFYLSVGIDR